jgi:hypothetical protein
LGIYNFFAVTVLCPCKSLHVLPSLIVSAPQGISQGRGDLNGGVGGKAMCYGIRELTGKKTPESNSIQRTGSPEMIEYTKMETMMRAWLKKWTPKRSVRDKKKRPVEAV